MKDNIKQYFICENVIWTEAIHNHVTWQDVLLGQYKILDSALATSQPERLS